MVGEINVWTVQRPAEARLEEGEAVVERAAAKWESLRAEDEREVVKAQAGAQAVERFLKQHTVRKDERRVAVVRARREERPSHSGGDLRGPVQLQAGIRQLLHRQASRNANVVPTFTRLSALSVAPCISSIRFAMARPRPAPLPREAASSPRQKRSKMCGRLASSIPAPVAETRTASLPPSGTSETRTWPPAGV